jgi:hypothetical protein
MNYDKVKEAPFDECEFISKVVETEEVKYPSTINVWMFDNPSELSKVSVTYIVWRHEGIKYISQPIPRSLDFVKLGFLREKAIKINISSSTGDYYFDLKFLDN